MTSVDSIPVKLPNLPGIRRNPIESPPKIFSKTRPRHGNTSSPKSVYYDPSASMVDNNALLNSYLDEFTESISSFPQNAASLSDTYGRYSIKAHQEDRDNKQLTLPFSNLDSVPSFVVNPKGRVCHFVAYYTEHIPENLKEPTRTRQVEIIYHVETKALEILEAVIPNSGLYQGQILKKMPVMNPAKNRNYQLEDFRAGEKVSIYSKFYTIVDCDNATKRYMSQLNFDFGTPQEIPNNNGIFESELRVVKPSYLSKRLRSGDEEKVLRFTGLWNNLDIQLFYKLIDNTISVVCINEVNPSDRRAVVQMILKNTKVEKLTLDGSEDESTILVSTAEKVGLPTDKGVKYLLHWHDLKIGVTLPMQGFNITILDADKATRQFYSSYGINLPDAIRVEKQKPEVFKRPVPPPTGFGSHDDSITSCEGSLVPHKPAKNLAKMKEFEDIKAQYRAILIDPVEPSENPRQFVIQMFMEDDNISISEIPEKNSGRPAGVFLAKRKLQNVDGTLIYTAHDLYAGKVVKINGYTFEIYHAAKKTLKFMESRTDIWPCCDIYNIQNKLSSIVDDIKLYFESSREYQLNSTLSIESLMAIMNEISGNSSMFVLHEIITLIRYLNGAFDIADPYQDVSEVITVAQLLNFIDSFSK